MQPSFFNNTYIQTANQTAKPSIKTIKFYTKSCVCFFNQPNRQTQDIWPDVQKYGQTDIDEY